MFDPTWGNFLQLNCVGLKSKLLKLYDDVYQEFNGSAQSLAKVQAMIDELAEIQSCINSNPVYTESGKAELIQKIDELKALLVSLKNTPCNCNCEQNSSNSSFKVGVLANAVCPLGLMPPIIDAIEGIEGLKKNKQCYSTEMGNIYSWLLPYVNFEGYEIPKSQGSAKTQMLKNFAKGRLAQKIIVEYYKKTHPINSIFSEYGIPNSSYRTRDSTNKNTGFADIVNYTLKDIFEIKADNREQEAQGLREVKLYVDNANEFCPPGNEKFKFGENFQEVYLPWPPDPKMLLKARLSIKKGVILYDIIEKEGQTVYIVQPLPQEVEDRLEKIMKKISTKVMQARTITVAVLRTIVDDELKRQAPTILLSIALTGVAGVAIGAIGAPISGGTSLSLSLISTICVAVSIDILMDEANSQGGSINQVKHNN